MLEHERYKRKKSPILDIAEEKTRFLLRLYVLGTLLGTITLYSRDDIFLLEIPLPLVPPGYLYPF